MSARSLSIVVLALLGAVGAIGLALSLPIHFRALSPLLLEEAAEGTPTLGALGDDFLTTGKPGPVALFATADPDLWKDPWRKERYDALMQEHPIFQFTGGPAPYFEQYLDLIDWEQLSSDNAAPPLLPLLLPRSHRSALRGFLERSSNATVADLLKTRQLSGYQRFLPAYSEAGHPLDAAILTTALLEQSNAWSPEVARGVRSAVKEALAEPANLAPIERLYLAIVTLGSRANWTQLTALLREIPDLATLEKLAAATHQPDAHFPTLYSALLLSGDPVEVLSYLEQQPEEGWEVLPQALHLGQGALAELIQFDQPLYQPPAWLSALPLERSQAWFRGFTQDQPRVAFALKLGGLFLAGFLLALTLSRLALPLFEKEFHHQHARRLEGAIHSITAIAFAVLVWIAAEPQLLEFAPNVARELRLDLAQILPTPNLDYAATLSAMDDQITLIVLLMFFVTQLAVFSFCLLKLKEIRGQEVPASVKLRVLDNEETLFDLGLYVGIGGTVLSLILIVLGIVQAIQMAAFSSTLFGIIFVALLKVFFVRPFRRRLILESAN
jgi:hypothetical protein